MGDKGLAIVLWVVVGALGIFAGAGWVAARASRGRMPGAVSGFLVGILILLLVFGLATRPLLQVVDLYSVGIELGIVRTTDVESSAGKSRNELEEPSQEGSLSGDSLRTAVVQMQVATLYTVALLAALVGAAVLGGIVGGRTPRRRDPDPRTAVVSLAVVMAVMAVLTIWLWPGVRATALALTDMDQSAGQDVGVNLTEVARHPEAMWGRTVTISGLVDRVLGSRAVLLGNDKPIVGDEVLVLGEERLADLVTDKQFSAAVLRSGVVAQVTGEVRPLAELNPDRLPTELTDYEGSAVLIAREISLDVPTAAPDGDKEFPVGTDGSERGVTVKEILDHPDRYVGQSVSVSAEVEEGLLTPHTFLLGDRGLLAVSAEPRLELFTESTAYVSGEVRRLHLEELEQELQIDLDDVGLRPHVGEPMIVVHSVELVT